MSAIILFFITAISIVILTSGSIISFFVYKKALELSPYNKSIEELNNYITELQITKDNLSLELESLSNSIDEAKNIISEKKKAEDFLNQYEELYQSRKDEIEKLNQDIEDISKNYQEKINQLNELDVNRTNLQKENQKLYYENENLKNEVKSLVTSIQEYKKELSALEDKLNNVKALYSELEAEIEIKKKNIDDLNSKIVEKKYELQQLNSSIDDAQDTMTELKGKIKEAELNLQTLTVEIKDKEVKEKILWGDLDRPYSDIQISNINLNEKDEINWIEEFKDNLNRCEIKFNERTINAFHTALKVQENSPLAVLSGISGTGKSLLPQLYAKAAGMNFLQVAVQPRWDSPQDMLGFYNYMQNKFKATELSRLLWQTDFYNNEAVKKEFKTVNNIPMNLILLDEMNLARVEYYFSDLLSKLEVRRTINPSNDNERKPAEIEIECGSLSQEIKPRRLFVNKNSLFVGTMNEDETTQTLSDKVMDRANVIRFGKPDKLATGAKLDEFMKSYSSDRYLSYKSWKNYLVNNTTSNIQDSVAKIVNELNECMQIIGRPFAHRVWQAIDCYVKYYPNTKRDFKNALSDQIEMKILPKLNGIEKDMHRDSLIKILNVLDKYNLDKELYNAFKKEIENTSSSFFQWKGVTR